MRVETDTTQRKTFQADRQREMAAELTAVGRLNVQELAESYGVTTETIRRDLSDLEEMRLARRVHGGAVPWGKQGLEQKVNVRTSLNAKAKRDIGRLAVKQIPKQSVIAIDSGSTLTQLAQLIPPDLDIQVVTNSIQTAQVLIGHPSSELFLLGGKVRKNTLAMVDAEAIRAVRSMSFDICFISCDGYSLERGLSTPSTTEATLKQAFISSANLVIALVDQSKQNQDFFKTFATWDEVDIFITDQMSDAMSNEIERQGPTVIRCSNAD